VSALRHVVMERIWVCISVMMETMTMAMVVTALARLRVISTVVVASCLSQTHAIMCPLSSREPLLIRITISCWSSQEL
jgi:hypothetical protein